MPEPTATPARRPRLSGIQIVGIALISIGITLSATGATNGSPFVGGGIGLLVAGTWARYRKPT